MLELPCVILWCSGEDDYQRNIYVTNVIFSTAWHPAHKREWGRFLQERWDPWSELPYNQNPKSGPKNWIKPWPAVTKGSADPLKSLSESRIRLRYLSNPPIPTPIHPLQMTCFSSLVDHAFTDENWWLKCISCFIVKYLSPSLSSAKVVRFFKLVELLYVILCQ